MITMDSKINDISNHEPSDRVFGMVVGTIFSLISVAPLLFGGTVKLTLLYFAIGLFAVGLLLPILLKWPKKIWLFITGKIAKVVNFTLLAIIFYLVVTPVALLFRIRGRDALKRKWEPDASTYWVSRESQAVGPMENQY